MKRKILLIEHDFRAAFFIMYALARTECEVKLATTGQEGLNLATTVRFDFIILGANLPDMNVDEVCDKLKERHFTRKIPVIPIPDEMAGQIRQAEHDFYTLAQYEKRGL
ncbi:MAG TPA: response regulator [Candidatus Acidoferrum sp.]|jgi:DNA-binding response OmpR family regulator|nr:response regulator [Candidatus Acidoferrum sp.]